MTKYLSIVALSLAAVQGTAVAQTQLPIMDGTWETDTPDGRREIIIRPDSSASYGDETVRWRLEGDSLHLAFGDEWIVYGYALDQNKLTLTGGDLEDPIELRRTGPATPLPEGQEIPAAPPADQRAEI